MGTAAGLSHHGGRDQGKKQAETLKEYAGAVAHDGISQLAQVARGECATVA